MRNVNGLEVLTEGVAKRDKLTIVDCYADWCGPCKMLKPILESAAQKYPDIEVVGLDIDANPDFAAANKIRGVPTLLWYKNGELVHTTVGVTQPKVLAEKIEEFR